MLSYALKRIAALAPTLLIIITVSFFVIRLAPGGPFDEEQTLPPEIKANLEAAYGLDQPLMVQYGRYLKVIQVQRFQCHRAHRARPADQPHDRFVGSVVSTLVRCAARSLGGPAAEFSN
jgi:ABC-type dipeptide/oligopeptide/nickel transport system permease component